MLGVYNKPPFGTPGGGALRFQVHLLSLTFASHFPGSVADLGNESSPLSFLITSGLTGGWSHPGGALVAAGHDGLKQGDFHGGPAPVWSLGYGINEDVQSRACSQSRLKKEVSQ